MRCHIPNHCVYFQVHEDLDLTQIAKQTEKYSGSDLRELCRNAAIYRIREYVREEAANESREGRDEFREARSANDTFTFPIVLSCECVKP